MSNSPGFVVLNYVNHRETVACVESILALPGAPRIVVVDNLSPNDSFAVLEQAFRGHPQVTVLQAGRNGGYSAGNNVGIDALRQAGVFDVVIATSDTRVESTDLLERCAAAKRDGVAVLGPYIRSPAPGSQNPMLPRLTLQYIAATHFGKVWTRLKALAFRTLLRGHVPATPHDSADNLSAPVDVYMVHGCFLYLSEHYLRQFPRLDEDLFMYGEEDLISFNCMRRGLRVVYDPRMRIYHGDGKSTHKEGERLDAFRNRGFALSLSTLRKKMPLGALIHAYVRGA